MKLKVSIYFIVLLFVSESCKKNEACNIVISSNNISCESENVANTVNGFIVNYYNSSTIKESEGNYENGEQVGFWKFYYSNGNLKKEVNFENGLIKGFAKRYFENGNLEMEGNYSDCKRNGFWKFYHNDAKNLVRLEGSFTDGNQSGVWKEYSSEGKLESEPNCN